MAHIFFRIQSHLRYLRKIKLLYQKYKDDTTKRLDAPISLTQTTLNHLNSFE